MYNMRPFGSPYIRSHVPQHACTYIIVRPARRFANCRRFVHTGCLYTRFFRSLPAHLSDSLPFNWLREGGDGDANGELAERGATLLILSRTIFCPPPTEFHRIYHRAKRKCNRAECLFSVGFRYRVVFSSQKKKYSKHCTHILCVYEKKKKN